MIDHRINTDLGWEPGTPLWAAQIIAVRAARIAGIGLANVLVRQTIWASRSEAVGFLERRMPTTRLPRNAPNGSRISGQVALARITVTPTDGISGPLFTEQLHVFLGVSALDRFHLDADGAVHLGELEERKLAAA